LLLYRVDLPLRAEAVSEKRELAIVSQTDLILQRREWKRNGKRVVCVSGAFDLLHPGHVRLLEHARGLGDLLVVGVRSDASRAAEDAASSTPLAPFVNLGNERAEILANLACVDYVTQFDEPTAREFIERLAPEVVAQGGKLTSNQNESLDDEAARASGAKVIRIPLEPVFSTARLLERIKQLPA
jgi:D-beta-D-heptose 7-phosphate kinase/D-beta-D-heptose 1-phosphate adenosyltransferase